MSVDSVNDTLDPRTHPLILRANAALFAGERAQVRRLLRDYAEAVASGDAAVSDGFDPDPLIVRWLDAQIQDQREARIERLRLIAALADTVEADTPGAVYVRLAARALDIELQADKHAEGSRPPRRWIAYAVIGIAVLVALALLISRLSTPAENAMQNVPTAITNVALPTSSSPFVVPPPDRSVMITDNLAGVEYTAGRLSAIREEFNTARAISLTTGQPYIPVEGARLYALQLRFECRVGICSSPPQARIELRADGDTIAQPITDAGLWTPDGIALPMQPIARDRVTQGWFFFQLPQDALVEALLVYPDGEAQDRPLFLLLGSKNSP